MSLIEHAGTAIVVQGTPETVEDVLMDSRAQRSFDAPLWVVDARRPAGDGGCPEAVEDRPSMRLACFDMDGTLIESYMDKAKGAPYGQIRLLPSRHERLQQLHDDGVALAVITNQAGPAFGYQSVDDVQAKIRRVIAALHVPMTPYVCCSHEKARLPDLKWGAGRRKPSPQMLLEAMRDHSTQPGDTLMVGNMDTDREAAHWAGCDYKDQTEFFAAA